MEREHEREEFQQEIQRLEEQLHRAAQPQARGPRDRDVSQCHGLQACVGERFVTVFLNFIFKNIFAFHVHGNDSRHSWMRRYVSSVGALSTCMASACDMGSGAPASVSCCFFSHPSA